MERIRKQKKTTALIRANKEGRKMEFLFPYLEEKGWTYEILTNMGVQINLDLVGGNRKADAAPVKQPPREKKMTMEPQQTSAPSNNPVSKNSLMTRTFLSIFCAWIFIFNVFSAPSHPIVGGMF